MTPLDHWLSVLPPHMRESIPVVVGLLDESGKLNYTTTSMLLTPEGWGEVMEGIRACVIEAYVQRGASREEIAQRVEAGRQAAAEQRPDIFPVAPAGVDN